MGEVHRILVNARMMARTPVVPQDWDRRQRALALAMVCVFDAAAAAIAKMAAVCVVPGSRFATGAYEGFAEARNSQIAATLAANAVDITGPPGS